MLVILIEKLSLSVNGELDFLYSPVIVALESIDDTSSAESREVIVILQMMRIFEFSFSIHLMRNILGITSELFLVLQRKDQDVVNAMNFLKITNGFKK